MKIKRNAAFRLFAYGKDKNRYQIRFRVTFNSQRLDLKTGCQLVDAKAWDDEAQLVKSGYKGPKGETALSINNELRNIKDQMDSTFKFFEAIDQIPTPSQLQKKYEDRLNGSVPQKPTPEPKKERKPKEHDFFKVYDMFLKECGEKNAWTEATFEKMEAMRVDLTTFKKNIKFSDLTEATLTEFVAYMRDSKKLRTPRKKKGEREDYDQEDLVGLKNSTIEKKLGYLRWFLNWATDRGYNTNLDYKKFHPTLKMTQRKVIYLTKEEIARVRDLELSESQAYLDPIRDIFLFCCFSGLR
ncbi:MAG: phage integrase SAM-like domain-containing protein, partial [Bacteroidales bacterium]|nr:phage integrase SAM-like domain-containing protein [Bacteroidales bacterium]